MTWIRLGRSATLRLLPRQTISPLSTPNTASSMSLRSVRGGAGAPAVRSPGRPQERT